MAHNRLTLQGLKELEEGLRNLPAHLAGEAGPLVEGASNGAASEIKRGYGAHVVTGNLRDHVVVTHSRSQAGAVSTVKSTSRHAYIFENGTQVRHTRTGANRGAMPPGHVFIPAVVRARRLLVSQLIGLVERAGFKVSGHV